MMRRMLSATAALVLIFSMGVSADDQAKKGSRDPASIQQEARIKQQILAKRFKEFEEKLLNLAQRLEKSAKAEDREKAQVLRNAIKLANESAVDVRFSRLVDLLQKSKASSLQEVKEAIVQAELLSKSLRAILDVLLSDREAQLRADQERIANILKELNKIIRDEKIIRAKAERNVGDPDALAKDQGKVTDATQKVSNAIAGKDGSGDKSGKPGDKSGKPGDKTGKPGDKSGKPGDKSGKPGDKSGEPGDSSGQQSQKDKQPGRKQIEDAIRDMKKAEDDLKRKQNDKASDKLDDAIKKLEEARKRLEEILRQLREEEIERLLAQLQQRCEYMLQLQREVYDGTVRLDKTIALNPKKKPTRPDEQASLKLSDREGVIVLEATKAITLLEAEGSSVAFAEVFRQVRKDMINVQRRLSVTDVRLFTQKIELDIISTLEEMIESLKKARQENKKPKPSKPGETKDNQSKKPLIELLAELKMIRAMQIRVNRRTEDYGKLYPGEQADNADIQNELRDLSSRQEKIGVITRDIALGRNR